VFGEKDLELATEGEDSNVGKFYDFGEGTNEDDDPNLEFFSITMLTGNEVGNHFIIPGTYDSRNFSVSYLAGELEILPASLDITTQAVPSEINFGDSVPVINSTIDGFVFSTNFKDVNNNELTLEENEESVIDTIAYVLIKGGIENPAIGILNAGSYVIQPAVTFIQPSNYRIGNVTQGSLNVLKATPTVLITGGNFEFDGNPKPATASVFGIGGDTDLLDQILLTITYQGASGSSYGPSSVPPVLPGTYTAVANFAGDQNYNPATSGIAQISIVGCVNQTPVVRSFRTAKGGGDNCSPATIGRPQGTEIGDLLIVGIMFEKGKYPSITPPDNTWRLIRRTNQSSRIGMATYFKIVTSANEPSSYGFRITNSPKWSMGISRISGADISHPRGPIELSCGAGGTTSSTARIPSLTTTNCNSLVLAFFTNRRDGTWSQPSGFTEVYDDPNTQQRLPSNMMAFQLRSEPGSTGSIRSTTNRSEDWVAQGIAIRPRPIPINNQNARMAAAPIPREATSDVEETMEVEADTETTFGELIAYPNPVIDRLQIKLSGLVSEFSAQRDVTVIDAVGRTHSVNSNWFEAEGRLELDFSRFADGLYVVTLRTDHGLQTVRVIKKSQ
jgi:hypothetical protein